MEKKLETILEISYSPLYIQLVRSPDFILRNSWKIFFHENFDCILKRYNYLINKMIIEKHYPFQVKFLATETTLVVTEEPVVELS